VAYTGLKKSGGSAEVVGIITIRQVATITIKLTRCTNAILQQQTVCTKYANSFYPRDAMLARVYATDFRLSVRVSHAYFVSQESCAITKMTARCADKSKQTATQPPKIT